MKTKVCAIRRKRDRVVGWDFNVVWSLMMMVGVGKGWAMNVCENCRPTQIAHSSPERPRIKFHSFSAQFRLRRGANFTSMLVFNEFSSYQQQIDSLSFIFVVEFLSFLNISWCWRLILMMVLGVVVLWSKFLVVVFIIWVVIKFKIALTYSFTSHILRRNAVREVKR